MAECKKACECKKEREQLRTEIKECDEYNKALDADNERLKKAQSVTDASWKKLAAENERLRESLQRIREEYTPNGGLGRLIDEAMKDEPKR